MPPSSSKQPMISSFFSQSDTPQKPTQKKRTSTPIDLTIDSDDEAGPSRKRARTTSAFFLSSSTPTTPRKDVAGSSRVELPQDVAEQWRFNPTQPRRSSQNPAGELEQRKRHDRARSILLGDRNLFRSRASPHETEFDVDDMDDVDNKVNDTTHVSDDDEETDQQFSELMEMFSNSKGKATKGRRSAPTLKVSSKQKMATEVGPSGQTYTPLELQIRELKTKYPDTILMVEVGYKVRFFGEDAKIASQALGIALGIVEQTETAALKKAGDTRNELFSRQLTHLYTSATYVDEMNSTDDLDPSSAPALMCLVEELKGGMGADERVLVGMVVISASTGDVVWDEFEGKSFCSTRMVHSKPYELLLPRDKLSKPSEKMIHHFTQYELHSPNHKIRIERTQEDLTYTEAFSYLTRFYSDQTKAAIASESYNSGKLMAAIADFPKLVVQALAYAVKYLSDFHVEDSLRETKFFAEFTERTHMLLNSNTLTNLEIYRNETDYMTKGSLMWILDHTTTKFGARMLRSWVGRPLTDLKVLQERIDAVEEILADKTMKLTQLRELLKRLPDLAKGLCRIQYGKCTPQELAILLPAFDKIATTFQPMNNPRDASFKSPILNSIVYALPQLREAMKELMGAVNIKMAKEGKKDAMWNDPDRYPHLDNLMMAIQVAESELADELHNIRRVLKKPALTYTTWNTEEYVVEIRKDANREIPATWQLLSRRYHPPEVRKKLQERAQYMEALEASANKAYDSFLREISQKHYGLLRDAVNKLAVADCLLSLARVALQEGYVKPQFTNEDTLEIVDGRHPMVEALRSDPFVPNSIHMGNGYPRSKIITGPNMGGKSSVVRMTALCAIMAQIGSYIPARTMKIGLLDGVLTRMGASDELARGRSTFMVEMQETSDILQAATPRTLVILDELGRGTSTFDGYLVQTKKSKTLFITHYPQVASSLELNFSADIENTRPWDHGGIVWGRVCSLG
ncbi:predicted protein [Postia placenta Mad-698-R]|uniref:MutS protein homolog 3 n=1 Tax=Postia placenta MAD-698-R-SB12 TaxID=670580 RepID=A0A1X6N845_9APHY|nr:hypothetical protein POSPLADRAFT_1134007 [Postia placenta MAD-698-R-SB12]EED81705.1 predicted protein [Postia placenta Mad-698-R]OSX64754.1 hypothetical protein POSPLADRAFT_1134007 [Postia placenta MAD-698-R-SB12]